MLPESPPRSSVRTTLFPAMGGTVEVHAAAAPADAGLLVQRLFASREAALSRFRADSELSALNRSDGATFRASPLLFDVLDSALRFARATRGLFDPTIIDALEAAGYDRTFDDVLRTGGAPTLLLRPAGRWRDIRLDRATRSVTMPAGTRVDLGGIGKGHTVDAAMRALGPAANAIVNASGDLYAAGDGPDGEAWRIGIADPHAPDDDLAVLQLRDRGVATSGTTRRAWMRGGRRMHHIIDPRSGSPAEGGAHSLTVVARDATTADALATAASLLAPDRALDFISAHGADALAVAPNGEVTTTPGMRRHLA